MIKRALWVFSVLGCLSFVATACGGDGDGDDGAGGAAGSGGGSGGAGGSGGSAGMAAAGKCVDEAGPLQDAVHGENEDMTITDIARTCGVRALSEAGDDPDGFITNCIQTELDKGGPGLSASCLECPVQTVQCAISNCASLCAADPTVPECITCLCGEGDPKPAEDCYAQSDACTGVPNTACEMLGL